MPIDPHAIDPNYLYGFSEAAALVGRSRRTVESWRQRKKFVPASGSCGRLLIRGSDLLRIVVGEVPPVVVVESSAQKRRKQEALEKKLRDLGLMSPP